MFLLRKTKIKIILLLMLFLISGVFISAFLNTQSISTSMEYIKPRSKEDPTNSKIVGFKKSIIASADASVDENFPESNNGTTDLLTVSGYDERETVVYKEDWTYLQFLLDEKPKSVKNANICLSFDYIHENATLGIYLVEEPWVESSITWNNKPQLGELITKFNITYSLSTSTYTLNITDYVEKESLSVCVKYWDENNTNGYGAMIFSKEGYYYDSNAPKIDFFYEKDINISVMHPQTNDTLTFGYNYVQWTTSEEVKNVYIDLIKGKTFVKTLNNYSISAENLVWEWYITSDYANLTDNDYRIRIRAENDTEIRGYSGNFTLNTTVDPSKGDLFGPKEPYLEEFNGENAHTYRFHYEFTLKQKYTIIIYDQENIRMMEREITDTSGSFNFEPDKTQVLSIVINAPKDGEYGYVKLSIKDQKDYIPGFPLIYFSFALMGMIGALIKKVK